MVPIFMSNTFKINRRYLKRISNFFKIELSFGLSLLFKKAVVWGNPSILMIEPTNLCNLKCQQCITGSDKLQREKGFMSYSQYCKIINQLNDSLLYLFLFIWGEPFLNKKIIEMIRFAADKGIRVSISTNGLLFNNDKHILLMLKSGLNLLTIVMHGGPTAHSYCSYNNSSENEYIRVINTVKKIVKLKKTFGFLKPIIDLQFILMAQNIHEIPYMKQLGVDLGVDIISFKKISLIDANNECDIAKYLPSSVQYSRYVKTTGRPSMIAKSPYINGCRRLWLTSFVCWDGNVTICCNDSHASWTIR